MNVITYLYILIIIVILIFTILFLSTSMINNNNIPQLDIIDKIELSCKCIVSYKLGIAFFREWDINSLYYIYRDDPLMLKLHDKFYRKYGKVAVVDTYIKKIYVIIEPSLAKKILMLNENPLGPSLIKKITFSKIMPNNIAISTNDERKQKRIINQEIFGTITMSPILKIIGEIIDNELSFKPINHSDFDRVSLKIISKLMIGKNDSISLKKLKNTLEYIQKDTNGTIFGLFNKFNSNLHDISVYKEYIIKNYNRNNKNITKNFLKLSNNNDVYLLNEMPHWIIPMYGFMSFMIPILLEIILSFKFIYDKIIIEINMPNFDIYSKTTYLHYVVIEHLRMFNIINMQTVRKIKQDVKIDSFFFKKNSEAIILFSSLLRDKIFFKNPNYFNPNRWKEKSIKEQNIVFGVGEQMCPSINFTPLVYKNYIYYLLKKFKYKMKKNKYNINNLPHLINSFNLKF